VTTPRLRVDGISKRFGTQLAVDDLCFSIAPGEIVGFVGPNGAGKSTTLRILSGLLTADSGRVCLDHIDQQDDPTAFKARLGALIEAPAIFPMLTAFEHLAFVSRIRRSFSGARIEAVLRDVGLDARSAKRAGQFSLGMKQRLGIAMALFAEPLLLILDEPMNGLDPSGIAELRDFTRRLPARSGTSVFLSSHLLSEIEQICHRVIFIRDGRLIAEKTLTGGSADALQTVWLRTDDDARATVTLRTAPFVMEVVDEGTGIACRIALHDVGRIAPLLVGAGITLLELTQQGRRLEEAYLTRYGHPAGTSAR